jgi:hypothetical protein
LTVQYLGTKPHNAQAKNTAKIIGAAPRDIDAIPTNMGSFEKLVGSHIPNPTKATTPVTKIASAGQKTRLQILFI